MPDLYFMLEVGKNSAAQRIIDARGDALQRTMDRLNQETGPTRWSYSPGGHETIKCRMSMLEVVRGADPVKSMDDFFSACLAACTKHEVLDLFRKAVAAECE